MRLRILAALWLLPGLLAAQTDSDFFNLMEVQNAFARRSAKAPDVDAKRMINESSSFLKEREPEMNTEEYALYEKVVNVLGSDPALALRLLEGMMNDKEPPSPAFEFILGNAYYAAGDYAKTETRYKGAVERYPTFLRAWNNLGVLYYTLGRFADAVTAFSKSVSLGDRDPTTFGLLGYSLEREGNLIAAEVAYMQALSGDPNKTDWQEGLLRLCMEGGQWVRAEGIARMLIKSRPTETRFWLVLANILQADNRKVDAMAVLETCVGAGVAGTEETLLLGDLYAEHGLGIEAAASYARVPEKDRTLGEERLLRFAQSMLAAGRIADASSALRTLPATGNPASRARRVLIQAQVASLQQRWGDARRDLEQLLAEEPRNGQALLALGSVDVAEGDDAHAALLFDAAVRIPETTYRASLELANLELRRRNYPAAVAHLQKALGLQYSDTVADYLARVKTLVEDEAPKS